MKVARAIFTGNPRPLALNDNPEAAPQLSSYRFLKKIEIQKNTEVCYFSGTGDVRKKEVSDGRLNIYGRCLEAINQRKACC